jgi:hypothetical protein
VPLRCADEQDTGSDEEDAADLGRDAACPRIAIEPPSASTGAIPRVSG